MVLFGNGGKKARLIGTALLVVTFVAGALAGAAAMRVVSAEGPEDGHEDDRPKFGGPRGFMLDEHIADEVGLSTEQRERVRAILEKRDREAKEMWESIEPRFHEFGRTVRTEIGAVLTPSQQKKLDAAIGERRSAWKERHRCAGDSTKGMKEEKIS